MPAEFRVISIGTLASHPMWNDPPGARTGHATTTLISIPKSRTHILVDPSLPPAALLARMSERTPVRAHQITHVFLTSADALHRRALDAFEGATWYAHEDELNTAAGSLPQAISSARAGGDVELAGALERQQAQLARCKPAPDALAPGVDLFPLPGVTPGCCGLLLPLPGSTVLVCGDAVPTIEHLQEGKVLPECADVERARESFAEAIEIADLLILGRDNIAANPVRRLA